MASPVRLNGVNVRGGHIDGVFDASQADHTIIVDSGVGSVTVTVNTTYGHMTNGFILSEGGYSRVFDTFVYDIDLSDIDLDLPVILIIFLIEADNGDFMGYRFRLKLP